MRLQLTALLTAAAVACVPRSAPIPDDSETPPSIVLIVFDDLGYGGFPAYQDDFPNWRTPVEAPHLDSLARSGTRFTGYYNASPVCSPTRISLLTGLYPQRLGIYKQLNPVSSLRGMRRLEDSMHWSTTYVSQQSGYRTPESLWSQPLLEIPATPTRQRTQSSSTRG